MTNNGAHDEGYDAYWEGVDVSDNPYEEDTDGRRSWEEGWRAARQHDNDESEGGT
jgi:ribosome modulation factor